MTALLNYLNENKYRYHVENDDMGYVLTIYKNGKIVQRRYPYEIENIVSARDLIEDIESEFND